MSDNQVPAPFCTAGKEPGKTESLSPNILDMVRQSEFGNMCGVPVKPAVAEYNSVLDQLEDYKTPAVDHIWGFFRSDKEVVHICSYQRTGS